MCAVTYGRTAKAVPGGARDTKSGILLRKDSMCAVTYGRTAKAATTCRWGMSARLDLPRHVGHTGLGYHRNNLSGFLSELGKSPFPK